ncbi:3-ketoacyl-CoA thiolase [bioreactor metagenome]|uniref:3-ketoacyl-CoA thiolase n=1 Tax=bioreactor metagenome TaxID=1076179 RepID=A0A645GBC1_9ZZZZ
MVKEAIARSGIEGKDVGHVVFGHVVNTEPRDMYISRVAAINGGCPKETPAMNVNRLCGSGLQAIVSASQAILLGDCDVAIGGGAGIAVEAAAVTLVGGDIARVAAGIELSRRTMAIIRQNLFWALGYNVVAIPFAAAGRLTPMIAAAAMAMSSLSVVGNSLRLQR